MVLVAALAADDAVVVSAQGAKDSTTTDIARYREMLADGSPTGLWEVTGEELREKPAGPKQASLEMCDLGLGLGVMKDAYARLPRFFKDTGRVVNAEQRLMYRRTALQGLTKEEVSARPFSSPSKASGIERLMAYVALGSRDMAIDISLAHPEGGRMYRLDRCIFFYRGGAYDFAYVTYHAQPGLRIRLRELPDLLTANDAHSAYSTWPEYRVSRDEVRMMQHRLYDCLRQQRFPEPPYGSEVATALEMFLARNTNGSKMDTSSIKH